MTSKNKKSLVKSFKSINNSNVNTKLKNPVPVRPKPTILEENFSSPPADTTSKPATTSKDTTIGLTESEVETAQVTSHEIKVSEPQIKSTKRKKQILKKEVKLNDGSTRWTDTEIKILLDFWRENLEEWKRGKMKVYKKMLNENLLPGRNPEQIKNKVSKLREMYLQKKEKANSTGEGNVEWVWYSQMEEILSQSKAVNPDYIIDSSSPDSISDDGNSNHDKENHEADASRKKKRKTGDEGLTEVIAAMGESRDRFYEKKLDLKERESQKRLELEERKLTQQYELEKSKLEIERLRAENEKVKLELEMLKFHKNNQ